MKARGGYEAPGSQIPLFVALHLLAPISMLAEVLLLGARPGRAWPFWLAIWAAAEAVRGASMRALGDRWSIRIVVVPGEPLVRRGPYRWVSHPIYLAVFVQVAAFPLVFGAWRTAALASLANLAILATRVRREHRALQSVAAK